MKKSAVICFFSAIALAGCHTANTQIEPPATATMVSADARKIKASKASAALMPVEVAQKIVQKYSFAPGEKKRKDMSIALPSWIESPYFERESSKGKACSRVNGSVADIDSITLFKTATPNVGYTAVTAHKLDDAKCTAGIVFTAQTEDEANELFTALKALGAPLNDLRIAIAE